MILFVDGDQPQKGIKLDNKFELKDRLLSYIIDSIVNNVFIYIFQIILLAFSSLYLHMQVESTKVSTRKEINEVKDSFRTAIPVMLK